MHLHNKQLIWTRTCRPFCCLISSTSSTFSLYTEQLLRKYTTAGLKRVKTDGFLHRTLEVFFVDLFKAYCLQAAGHLNVLKLVGFINIVD